MILFTHRNLPVVEVVVTLMHHVDRQEKYDSYMSCMTGLFDSTKGLCEAICNFVLCRDIFDPYTSIFGTVRELVKCCVDQFSSIDELLTVRNLYYTYFVNIQVGGAVAGDAAIVCEGLEPQRLLKRIIGGHILGLTTRTRMWIQIKLVAWLWYKPLRNPKLYILFRCVICGPGRQRSSHR